MKGESNEPSSARSDPFREAAYFAYAAQKWPMQRIAIPRTSSRQQQPVYRRYVYAVLVLLMLEPWMTLPRAFTGRH
jgi:hypothetical protein